MGKEACPIPFPRLYSSKFSFNLTSFSRKPGAFMAHLLMVDDNPQSQRYIERIIRLRTAHEIAFARDSKEGIEKMVAQRPALIFLDLFLPGMSGFDFFEMLRSHPATANIPIVIHTAVPLDPITKMRLRKVKSDGFVEFPIAASELIGIIDSALHLDDPRIRKWTPPSV